MLCTLIGAIILSINIQVGLKTLNMHLYDEIGMHRRPFEGRHLVGLAIVWNTLIELAINWNTLIEIAINCLKICSN